jgi:hypothetical protein
VLTFILSFFPATLAHHIISYVVDILLALAQGLSDFISPIMPY